MIDASIYNLQKPLPAPVNPMEVAGHAMQLRNAQQTNQLNAERLKQEQQQTAAAEQALADERTARTTLAEHGGDLDKAIPALAGKISTGAWEKLNKQASDLRKARAEMDEKDRAKLDWQLGMLSDARLAVLNAPPDQKEAEHQRQGQRIAAIAPDLAQKWEPQYPGDDAVKSEIGFAKWFKSDQEQKDAARKAQQATDTHANAQREAELHPLKVQKAQTDAQLGAMEVAGEKPIQPADRTRIEREAAAAKETARHNRAMEAVQNARVSMEGSTTVMAPNPDGTYRAVRVKPGESVPAGSISTAGMNSLTVPTAATRSMQEAAPKVTAFVDRIEQLVNEQEKNLGPASGRMREFLAGKIGAKDPEYTKLRTDIGLLQTALMRMHVGARGGVEMMGHFKSLIDSSKQDPENLRAALSEIRDYANTVAGAHGSGGGAANSGGPKPGQVINGYRFKGGDPNTQASWEPVKK